MGSSELSSETFMPPSLDRVTWLWHSARHGFMEEDVAGVVEDFTVTLARGHFTVSSRQEGWI